MARKFLDLVGLQEYDEQIKAYIDAGDDAKAPASHTHDDRYYTESEIDSKLSGKSDTGHKHAATDITSGTLSSDRLPTVPVAKGGTGATTEASARTNLDVYSKGEVDSKVSTAVSGLASTSSVNTAVSNHNSSTSAHSDIRAAIAEVKEDVDTFFADADFTSSAKDTLKEIQTYIDSDAEAASEMLASINGKADKATTLAGYGITNAYTKTEVDTALSAKAAQSSLDSHTGDTTVHITATERTNWNAAKTHADSAHAPSNAQPNQNAFSNVKVGTTTVAADTTTDTIEFVGSNVTITPDATNNKITFAVATGSTSAKGVVQLTNSTSSTSTTTAATPSSVKSAYDLANTAKTNAATAQTAADAAQDTADEAKSAAAANTQSIQSNTSSISAHTTRITALETKVGEGFTAITSDEISALFA